MNDTEKETEGNGLVSATRATIKMQCKYCGKYDAQENMHKDIYTKEYYHNECRPSVKSGQRQSVGRPPKSHKYTKYD